MGSCGFLVVPKILRRAVFAGHREEVRTERGELYPPVKVIDDTQINAKRFQTNRICERFQKTVFNDFYRVALRNKIDKPVDELQTDLAGWVTLDFLTKNGPDLGKWCYGKTLMQMFLDSIPLARE